MNLGGDRVRCSDFNPREFCRDGAFWEKPKFDAQCLSLCVLSLAILLQGLTLGLIEMP